jgi:hypothetical protein
MINQMVRKKNPTLFIGWDAVIILVINHAGIAHTAYMMPKIIQVVIAQSTYLRFWISSYLTLLLVR